MIKKEKILEVLCLFSLDMVLLIKKGKKRADIFSTVVVTEL